MLKKIISGGQTGADRAAWDAALDSGLPIGGWVPRGRRAEDGIIPARYADLLETTSTDVVVRTEKNVIDSDGTLILSHRPLSGGTEYTLHCAEKHNKQVKCVDLDELELAAAVIEIETWLQTNRISKLNVAGPRLSEDALIYDHSYQLLMMLFKSHG